MIGCVLGAPYVAEREVQHRELFVANKIQIQEVIFSSGHCCSKKKKVLAATSRSPLDWRTCINEYSRVGGGWGGERVGAGSTDRCRERNRNACVAFDAAENVP